MYVQVRMSVERATVKRKVASWLVKNESLMMGSETR